jgi:hypothetical protein
MAWKELGEMALKFRELYLRKLRSSLGFERARL